MMQQRNLSDFTFQEALDYKASLHKQIGELQDRLIYWSGICDFLKDKEFQDSEKAKKLAEDEASKLKN